MNSDAKENVNELCRLLYEKKAQDIVIIDVRDKTIIADNFIICSGRSNQQVKALCDEIEEKAPQFGLELRRKEGYTMGRWIVMDFSDILVHIFHPEEREYYNIERLWKDNDNFTDYSALMET
ncbi:Ribosomal silencing factor RsfS [bioreactor metagenome]|uniref:Ribosomal silencing factor RsfS n=1 Tax=bioreactor metagenome TaxID=1076179 RepID=A0A645E3B2_9ZZZZ